MQGKQGAYEGDPANEDHDVCRLGNEHLKQLNTTTCEHTQTYTIASKAPHCFPSLTQKLLQDQTLLMIGEVYTDECVIAAA